jgi:hypothetical protein
VYLVVHYSQLCLLNVLLTILGVANLLEKIDPQKMKLILALIVITIAFNSQAAVQDDTVQATLADSTKKLTVLNRLFNAKATDHLFTADKLEEQIVGDAGYVFDATLGRIALRYEDLPDCPFLTPIYKLSQPVSTNHILMVGMDLVNEWFVALANQNQSNWKYVGIIGYGVLHQNTCGATAKVRHFTNEATVDQNSQSIVQILTTNDTEAADLPKRGINRSKINSFYIWTNE